MKARPAHVRSSQTGYVLLFALIFVTISLIVLTSMLAWTFENTALTDRNNEYNRTVGAAEAATEKVLSLIGRDFANQTYSPANLPNYRNLIPTTDWATDYEFSDGDGNPNRVWVDSSAFKVPGTLDSQIGGLYGSNYTCRTRANAKLIDSQPELAVAVRQDFQLASLPIFQFAIYYAMDLELNHWMDIVAGGAIMVNGKVHGNADIYCSPPTALRFADAVEAVGKIYHYRHPNDPTPTSGIVPTYDGLRLERTSSLTLPTGSSSNSPAVLRAIVDPPGTESFDSTLGKQRYYNKCDLLVIPTTTNFSVYFNAAGDGSTPVTVPPIHLVNTFLKTNTFYDYRENKMVVSTDIDVGRFNTWMTTNSYAISLTTARGRLLNSIYIDDQRILPATRLAAVRVVNARTLTNALTIATARPLYVLGNFNAPDLLAGSTNTALTKPASLVGDSITVLSENWKDVDYVSGTSLGGRLAISTTVNAALLTGIVPTANVGGIRRYSGGAENLTRFLEDWRFATFTFNGSMVAMFPSRYATNVWMGGDTYDHAPTRKWFFDPNFLNWNRLPPGTPMVQKMVRGRWNVIAPNSPN